MRNYLPLLFSNEKMRSHVLNLRRIFVLAALFVSVSRIHAQGAALAYDGVNDYVQVASQTFSNTWTAEAWVDPAAVNAGPYTILGQSYANNGQGFYINIASGNVQAVSPSGLLISAPISANAWHHVALTYSFGVCAFYLDGKLIGTQIQNIAQSSTSLIIGARTNNANNGIVDEFFGTMDEVRIWNVARTGCEIQTTMLCEITSTATGLVANYHFNHGSNAGLNLGVTTLVDAAGNNDGTLNNFLLLTAITNSNWIAPGAVTTGFTTVSVPGVEINVRGNGTNIADGDVTPTVADFTDFGTQNTRAFLVQNTGTGSLSIARPFFTGADAASFSVTALTNSLVAASGVQTFVVTFAPTSVGTKTAVLRLYSNDCDEPVYDFVVRGEGAASALHFDGVDDAVILPASSGEWDLGNDYTLELWAKPTTTVGSQLLLYAGFGCISCPAWALSIGQEATCSAYGTAGRFVFMSMGAYVESAAPAPTGVWSHIAVTYNGSVMKMYLNGVLQSTAAVVGVAPNTSYMNLGADPSNLWGCSLRYAFSGAMDELRMWDHALCQSDIQNNMNCEINTSLTGLRANYHFNQGVANYTNSTVTSLADAGTNGASGSLSGFALTGNTSNWTSGSPVLSGSACALIALPDLHTYGNGNFLAPGTTSTSLTDNTFFGTVVSGSVKTTTFVIKNNGRATLNISGITFSGANAAEYTVTTAPSSTVAALTGSTSFVVSFSGTVAGTRSAVLSINSDDCEESPYSYALAAVVVPAGAALSFDGTDDVVQTSIDCDNDVMPALTLEAWIYPTVNDATYRQILSIDDGSWDRFLGMNGGSFILGTGSQWIPTTISLNQWQHVAIVYSGNQVRFYKNGIEYSTTTSYPNGMTSGLLTIGCRSTPLSEFFGGKIDEVRVWNTARTHCEILSYMNCEIPTTATGLVANYHFNQGIAAAANTVVALSNAAAANSATLTNFALTGSVSNWVEPGAVTAGFTVPSVPSSSLVVSGNAMLIPHGSNTPNTGDFTDFSTTAITRTYFVQNPGTALLYLNGVTLTGGNANQFAISTAPPASLSASGTSSFIVSFIPSSVGTKTAVINIQSSDCTNPTYTFVISATATLASALSFDGASDYIETNLDLDVDVMPNTTWEVWAYPTTTVGSSRAILSIGDGGLDRGLFTQGNQFFVASGGTFAAAATFTANQWYHLALVYATGSNDVKLYVNGVQVYTVTSNYTSGVGTTTNNLKIGAVQSPASFFFTGNLDEVRIWNTVRTQCEIQTFMNCEIPGSATGLVANYHFNQGVRSGSNTAVTVLTDAAGTNTATLSGFALTGTVSNWISPGAVVNGNTVSASSPASLTVNGNGNNIAHGSTSTTTLNLTDFSAQPSRTFVIQNAGTGTLYINAVSITGAAATDFSIAASPAVPLTTAGSGSLVITFTPGAIGNRTAVVTINSSDCANPGYSFVISSSVSPAEALHFDGVNDQVQIANTTALDNLITGNFSFEAWVKPSGTGFRTILSKGDGSGVPGTGEYIFQLDNSNRPSLFHTATNGWLYAGSTLTNGVWSHIAVTYDGSHVKFYVDGVFNSAKPSAPVSFTTGNVPVLLGRQGTTCNCNFFAGAMDEVRIWNVARTACEIYDYMRCEIPSSASGLLANYHFNQGIPSGSNTSVTTVTDATGTNNGTVSLMNLTGTTSNWISPGAVVPGFTVPSSQSATLSLSGNGNPILPGSTTASTLNLTDFGTATTRTLVLTASGTGTIYLANGIFTGGNASNFSITTIPSTMIPAGVSTSVVITFSGTAVGSHSAILTVFNNDCSAPNYSFVVTASVAPAEALSFDGVNDIARSGIFSNITGSLTLEAKIYPTSLTGTNQIIVYNGNTSTTGYGLFLSSTGELTGLYGSAAVFNTSVIPQLNQWTSVALTIQNGIAYIYVNGVLVFTGTGSTPSTPTDSFVIGANQVGTENFRGKIDEVRFWNKPLSQCELLTIMNCEIAGAAPNLLANYHFNNGIPHGTNASYSTVPDASGNNRTLTMNNFALSGTTSNWVSPGAVVSGFTTTSPPTATLNVTGNGNNIVHGSTSPATSNHTDFGSLNTRTFVITNTGSGTLYINKPVQISGPNATAFSVTTVPATSLGASASTSFVVTFTPGGFTTESATLQISSSDCTAPAYSFAISGTGTNAAAMHFDGVNDYIETNTSITELGKGDFTLEAWLKTTQISQGIITVANNTNTTWDGGEKCFYLDGSGRPAFVGYANDYITSTLSVNDGAWHHVAVVYDYATGVSGVGKIYIDGVDRTGFVNYTPHMNNVGTFKIGKTNYNGSTPEAPNNFSGYMDAVRIWNVPRSECEIQTWMNAEITGTMSGLQASYNFNQGIAGGFNGTLTTVTDNAGAITGTVTNFALAGPASNWVAPGQIVPGFTTVSIPQQEISVTGNGINILKNDYAPYGGDLTDFGTGLTATFVIHNTGSAPLSILNVAITGAHATEFSISSAPPSTISASSSASLVITYANTVRGLRSARVVITSDDCDEPVYDFSVTAGERQLYVARYNAGAIAKARTDFANVCPSWMNVSGASIGTAVDNVNKKLYFTGYGTGNIGVVSLDGSALNNSLVTGQNSPIGIAVDEINQKLIYALDAGSAIRMVNTNGSGLTAVATVSACYDVAVDPYKQKIYFVSFGSNNIGVVNYDGSGLNTAHITGCSGPYGLCVDLNSGKLLWANTGNSSVGSANLDGSGINQSLVSGASGINDLVVDNFAGKIFYTNGSGIGSADLNGSNHNTAFQTGLSGAWGIALGGYISPSVAISASSPTLCAGTQVVLTASTNAVTYTWSSGATTASASVSPSVNSTYTLVVTDAQSCTLSAVQAVTVTPSPTVLVAASATAVCTGAGATFTASGADTFTWTGGIQNAVTFTPAASGSYSVSGTNTLTGCSASATQAIVVNVLPVLSISGTNTLCETGTTTLTATGAVTFTWSSGPTGSVISLSPLNSTAYTVTGTDVNACQNTATVNVTVFPNPTVTASSASICSGDSYTVITSGANTYSITGNNMLVTPGVTTTYSVSGTSTAGCISMTPAVITITVHTTPSITVNSGTICEGFQFVMSPAGAVSYTYAGGSPSVSPLSSTSYTVMGTSAAGCVSTLAAISSVTVYNSPAVTVASGSVCNGGPYTLAPAGAINYTITEITPVVISSTLAVSPTITTSYSVTGESANGCVNNPPAIATVTVHSIPVITASSGSICTGEQFTVVPGGGASYSITGNNFVVAPLVNTSYTVSGTSTAGCASTLSAIADITVHMTPSISVNSGTICEGFQFVMSPTGAVSYTYAGGSPSVAPLSNTTYTVMGTSLAGCISTLAAVSSVTVFSAPAVSVSGGTICNGQTFTLVPSGAISYTITDLTPTVTANTLAVSPTITTSYSVVGESINGCRNTPAVAANVTVFSIPVITANSGSICSGEQFTIVPGGAANYSITGNNFVVSPLVNSTYSVSGTSTAGCASTLSAVSDITVHLTPSISVNSGSICQGFSFVITPTGAATYSYAGGSATVTPLAGTSYTVMGTSLQGCTSTVAAVSTVTVYNSPTVAISGGTICSGDIFTLTPSGAISYTITDLTPIVTSGSLAVTPTITTNYSVIGESANGCVNNPAVVATVTVHAIPAITVNSGSICTGEQFTINPSGASVYSVTGNLFVVSPTITTSYSVSGTSTAGCSSTVVAVSDVTVHDTPAISVNSGTICQGETYVLLPSGANTYTIAGGSASVSPMITSSYTVAGTSTAGCVSTVVAVSNVTVFNTPTITVNSGSVCLGESFTITPSGAASYTIEGGLNVVSPAVTTSYSVAGTSTAGCISNTLAMAHVTVEALPVISMTGAAICIGQSYTLTPSGATNYTFIGGGPVVSPTITTSYSVAGSSTAGCPGSALAVAEITVELYPVITFTNGAICNGQSFTLQAEGASTYTFSGGSSVVSPSVTSTYTISGSSPAGCTNTVPAIATVTVHALPTLTVGVSKSKSCAGDSISLNATGALTYTWSNAQVNNVLFVPQGSETATVTGADINGCSDTAQVSFTVNPLPKITVTGSDSVICAGLSGTLQSSGALTYTWNTLQNDTAIIVTPTVTTVYSVTGTDASGCGNITTYTLIVSPCRNELLAVPMATDITCSGRNDGTIALDTVVAYRNSKVRFIWEPAGICPDSSCTTLKDLKAGVYGVTMQVTYPLSANVSRTDSVVIRNIVISDRNGPCGLVIYNGVTPNNDGLNDRWEVKNIDLFPKNRVSIFNRWGVLLFETEGYNNTSKAWPQLSESAQITEGTYFYILDPGDGTTVHKGFIEVSK